MGTQATERYTLDFDDIVYSVSVSGSKEKKPILNGISGRFRPGRLSAILGPSGAGKTTLLNVLSGLSSPRIQGSVKINGIERNPQTFRQLACYITQEFSMFPVLTVRETLDIAAHIKLGNKITKSERRKLTEEIANVLGLKKVLNSRVNKLSGGEKKRLSIGVELVTNPPIMFFDEPTSGLDSVSSLQVVSHLKNLTKDGRTIIMVIHQPSSRLLECVDDVIIMTEGRCLYNGSLDDFIPTLNSLAITCPQYYNRADFALELACRERGDHVNQLVSIATKKHHDKIESFYKDNFDEVKEKIEMVSEENETELNAMLKNGKDEFVSVKLDINNSTLKSNIKEHCKPKYSVSKLIQFKILLHRSVICNLRDFKLAFLKVVTHIIVGLSLGAVYYNFGNDGAKVFSNLSCLFFIVIFIFYGTVLHTVMTFPLESSAIIREHFNNWYPLGVYHLAKTISDIPLNVICPTLFITIPYYMSDQPLVWDRYSKILFTGIIMTFLAQTLGCVMGAAFETQLAIFLAATGTMPTFLISGFFIHLNDLSPYISWLSYISIFRYSLEAFVVAIYGFGRGVLNCSTAYCHFKQPRWFLRELGMEKADYWMDATVLIILTLALQVILYYTMKYKVSRAIRND